MNWDTGNSASRAGPRAGHGHSQRPPTSTRHGCGTSAASRQEATAHSATFRQRITSPRSTRSAEPSHCGSRPASASCTPALGFTAKHFSRSFVQQVRKPLNAYDQQVLLRPEIATVFGEACAECFAHGSDGLVRDAELLYRRWTFDVSTIRRPVHIWQGLDDKLVPDPINKAVADATPGAVWHPVEGAGHFVAVDSGDDIFAIAADELGAT